jgi:hypothetical protein
MTDLEIKEYNKEYREKNKENIKKYSIENKENKKIYMKIYIEENKLKIKENKKEYDKEYYQNNKEKSKEYYQNNKEKIKEYRKINKEHFKQYYKKYQKNKKEIDYLYKLTHNIRSLILKSIKKQGYSKNTKTYQILGCTYEEFKKHLERQFKIGMNWNNQGLWHLDHIIPVSLAKDEAELLRLNHYTNFQPMWAIENISKGNKIIPNTQIKLV